MRTRYLAIIAACLVVLAACTQEGAKASPPSQQESAAQTTASASDAQGLDLPSDVAPSQAATTDFSDIDQNTAAVDAAFI